MTTTRTRYSLRYPNGMIVGDWDTYDDAADFRDFQTRMGADPAPQIMEQTILESGWEPIA